MTKEKAAQYAAQQQHLMDDPPGESLQQDGTSVAEYSELKKTEDALRRQLEELSVLHAVATAGAEANDVDTLIERATQIIGEAFYPDNFGLIMLDEGEGCLIPHPSYRQRDGIKRYLKIPMGQGVSGSVASDGKPRRIADVTQEPVYLEVDPSTRSELCVPLKVGERVIGVVNAESDQLDAFTKADERLLVTLARQLATAIDRLRAEAAGRHRAEQLAILYQASQEGVASLNPDQVYAALHQAAAQLVPTDAFVITLLDEARQEIIPAYLVDHGELIQADPIPASEGLSGHVIATGKSVLVDDPQQIEKIGVAWAGGAESVSSILAVPIRLGGKVLGMLSSQSYKPNVYHQDDLQALSTLANQAAFGIENARLFMETQRRAQQLSVINELAREMTSLLDIDTLYALVTQRLFKAFRYFNVAILTLDEQNDEAVLQAIARPREKVEPGRYRQKVGHGVIGRSLATGDIVLVNDTRKDPDFFQITGNSVLSELVIPLKIGRRIIGVLNIDGDRVNTFDQSDVDMLTTVADQFAVTLEKARLLEETQRRLQEVTFLSQIIAITTTEKDLASAFQKVCAELARFFNVPEASFVLMNTERSAVQVIAEYLEPDRPSGLGFMIPLSGDASLVEILEVDKPISLTTGQRDSDMAQIQALMRQRGIASLLIVPIIFGGDVVGALEIADVKPRAFNPSEIDLVQRAASQVSQAVERLALFAATSEQAELMGILASLSEALNRPFSVNEVIEAIGKGAMRLGKADHAAVFLREGEQEAVCAWSLGLSENYLTKMLSRLEGIPGGQLLQSKEAVLMTDVNNLPEASPLHELNREGGYRAMGIWPLVYENYVIAAIGCYYASIHRWSEAEQEVMQAFARQATVALQNARLFEETHRRSAHLEALNSIITAVAAASDLKNLLEVTIDYSLHALGLQQGGIWIAGQSIVRGISDIFGVESSCISRLGDFDLSATIAVEDWKKIGEDNVLFDYAQLMSRHGLRASLTVSILAEGRRIGGLSLASTSPRKWDNEDVALLEGVGRQLGGAVERIELLERIQINARRVQQIMDSVPEGVLLLDEQKDLVLANPAAQEYLQALGNGNPADLLVQLAGKTLEELLGTDGQSRWHELTTQETPRRVYELATQPFESGEHQGGWVIVLRDVTKEREAQTRIQMQERLATVGQLAAGIAHDFNNILAAIVVYADLLKRDTSLPPASRERIAIIQQQVQRAASLIRQILDFSRRSVMEQNPLDLLPFVKELEKLLRRVLPETIRVEMAYHPGTYRVKVDPTRLQQAFMNLAVNARDAMPAGGILEIVLERLYLESGEQSPCPIVPSGEWIRLTIKDNGHGIPPDVMPHIFEPFFTTKPVGQGTGLGLAQAYGIVKQHDGYIDAHSQPGEGATFHIYLPPLASPEDEAKPAEAEAEVAGQGETILVVEDDLFAREAMRDLLEAHNYQVLMAQNGLHALQVYEQQGGAIALVISDLVMPEMGGVALYAALKERWPLVKMLFITGHPLHGEDQALLEKSEVHWLQKPFSVQDFSEAVQKLLTDVP